MTKQDLHQRLASLDERISATQTALQQHRKWTHDHRLNSGELIARHRYLKEQLDAEVDDLRAHGNRVSALEASVREWIDGLNLTME